MTIEHGRDSVLRLDGREYELRVDSLAVNVQFGGSELQAWLNDLSNIAMAPMSGTSMVLPMLAGSLGAAVLARKRVAQEEPMPGDFQLYKPRKGRTHIVCGWGSKRLYCNKADVTDESRLVRGHADDVDCQWCLNYLVGHVRKLFATYLPSSRVTPDRLLYLRDVLDEHHRMGDHRLVCLAIASSHVRRSLSRD